GRSLYRRVWGQLQFLDPWALVFAQHDTVECHGHAVVYSARAALDRTHRRRHPGQPHHRLSALLSHYAFALLAVSLPGVPGERDSARVAALSRAGQPLFLD